jgi:hypothetical protein
MRVPVTHDFPEDTLPAMALWLARHMDRVRQHEAAADIVREVTAAVRHATRVIDRPPQRVYAGPCDCGRDLRGWPGRTLVSCEACGATYGIAERQEWMRNRLDDHLGSAEYAAGVLPGIGIHVTAAMVRGWAHRHRLEARCVIPPRYPGGLPSPQYRMGDIIGLALAREAARSQ